MTSSERLLSHSVQEQERQELSAELTHLKTKYIKLKESHAILKAQHKKVSTDYRLLRSDAKRGRREELERLRNKFKAEMLDERRISRENSKLLDLERRENDRLRLVLFFPLCVLIIIG